MMIYLVIVTYFVLISVDAEHNYVHTLNSGEWLEWHNLPVEWEQAKLNCQLRGGVLASPDNDEIKHAMMTMLMMNQVSDSVFTGISVVNNTYYSIKGVKIDWASLEPASARPKTCLAMTRTGDLIKWPCNNVRPYLCLRKSSAWEHGECGEIGNGYKLDLNTRRCFKFHQRAESWSNAFMTCAAEGAHLAIINSEDEAETLKTLIPSKNINYFVYIGFQNWGQLGDFKTIHGQTFEEAGYSRFCENEPNHLDHEFCGAMVPRGCLHNMGCESKIPFICEKTPDT